MSTEIKTYIFYEIGDSCRSEFFMRNERFSSTEDAVVIGVAKGKSVKDAFKNLEEDCSYLKNYKFDNLVARAVGAAVYL